MSGTGVHAALPPDAVPPGRGPGTRVSTEPRETKAKAPAVPPLPALRQGRGRRPAAARLLVVFAAILCVAPILGVPLPDGLSAPSRAWIPAWTDWAGDAMMWLAKDAELAGVPFSDLTRGIAQAVLFPMHLLQGLLSKGIEIGDAELPPLPWLSVTASATAAGLAAGGWRLALLTGGALVYAALLNLWEPTMLTLASVSLSVLVGVLAGVALGVAAWRRPWVDRAMQPVYDMMQTVPIFAYLVPILYLFGFGPVGALAATVIYAMPPMARVTTLALRGLPESTGEAAAMAGCSRGQVLRLALLPSALPQLLVGVNQVVMLSLTMVIIASVIGAGGLGAVVLESLQSLRVGRGLEAGFAIVLIAIALDRLGQAAANGARARAQARRRRGSGPLQAWRWPLLLLACLVLPALLSLGVDEAARWPRHLSVSAGGWWDDRIAELNLAWADGVRALKIWVFTWLLLPVKMFALSVPWSGLAALVGGLGLAWGGWRLGLGCFVMMGFVAFSGYWQAAQLTLYLVTISGALCLVIGMPIGVLCSTRPRLMQAMTVMLDTIQTLPSFVYLIPAIMLLGTGDFPALIAIVVYAVTPAIRYTAQALHHVPPQHLEAARMAGATRAQTFFLARAPLARAGLLLAVNQTVMMVFGMLVITALIGTKGLERDTLLSLSKADPGRGLVAGAAMAFLAIIIDRLLRAAAGDRTAGGRARR